MKRKKKKRNRKRKRKSRKKRKEKRKNKKECNKKKMRKRRVFSFFHLLLSCCLPSMSFNFIHFIDFLYFLDSTRIYQSFSLIILDYFLSFFSIIFVLFSNLVHLFIPPFPPSFSLINFFCFFLLVRWHSQFDGNFRSFCKLYKNSC